MLLQKCWSCRPCSVGRLRSTRPMLSTSWCLTHGIRRCFALGSLCLRQGSCRFHHCGQHRHGPGWSETYSFHLQGAVLLLILCLVQAPNSCSRSGGISESGLEIVPSKRSRCRPCRNQVSPVEHLSNNMTSRTQVL